MRLKVKRFYLVLFWAFLLSVIPGTVYAHPGDSVIRFGSFFAGLTHPVLGLDHFLAMLSVGIVSAQIGGRAIWTVPGTFVGVMAVGGLIGAAAAGFSYVETGIALSVLILGSVIAAERKLPIALAMVAVAFFALFHGYAHGSEIPAAARPFIYAAGFLTGTAIIHVLGVFLGDIPRHYSEGRRFVRYGGIVITTAGLLFLFGLL